MMTVTLPPGYRPRGLSVLYAMDPRWDPEVRRTAQHEPEHYDGPQDPPSVATKAGLPLWAYFLGVIASTGFLVGLAGEGLEHSYGRAAALLAAVVVWICSMNGLMDYARRGARR